jgi:hypothetical protein
MLVHCSPNYLHLIDSDVWEDELRAEDDYMELPSEVQGALDALNEAIKKAAPVTWTAKAVRVSLPLRQEAASV